MRWTHDLTVGAYYFALSDTEAVAGQRELAPGLIADLDSEGNLVGLEVISSGGAMSCLQSLTSLALNEIDQRLIGDVLLSGVGGTWRCFGAARPWATSADPIAESPVPYLQDA